MVDSKRLVIEIFKMGPKEEIDLIVGKYCPICDKLFEAGQYTTLIPMGPGEDPDTQEKARNNEPYSAIAMEVHWSCATGQID